MPSLSSQKQDPIGGLDDDWASDIPDQSLAPDGEYTLLVHDVKAYDRDDGQRSFGITFRFPENADYTPFTHFIIQKWGEKSEKLNDEQWLEIKIRDKATTKSTCALLGLEPMAFFRDPEKAIGKTVKCKVNQYTNKNTGETRQQLRPPRAQ